VSTKLKYADKCEKVHATQKKEERERERKRVWKLLLSSVQLKDRTGIRPAKIDIPHTIMLHPLASSLLVSSFSK